MVAFPINQKSPSSFSEPGLRLASWRLLSEAQTSGRFRKDRAYTYTDTRE